MYAVVTMHDTSPSYVELGELTDTNKKKYCERHGYGFHLDTNLKPDKMIGFEKIPAILKIFKENPNYEWILFAESDTMITNFKTKIEDLIDNNYHFIIAVDVNDFNAGVFLVRNSEEGRKYLEMIYSLKGEYTEKWRTIGDWRAEQGAMIDTYKQNLNVVKVVNQRFFNSFDYRLYDYVDQRDCLWQDGNWKQGDFIIHWPACSQELRIKMAKDIERFIIQ